MNRRIGQYEILERVGEGGMGVVYKGRDTQLDRITALKFLPASSDLPEDSLEAFLHEARAISRLNHPSIATVYAVAEENGERFLALEYLPGGSLRDRLRENPEGFSTRQVLAWASNVASALAHAHRHGIVHRDVKADNVLLTAENEAKLTDFGVAQVSGGEGSPAFDTAGTSAYLSPEQAQGLPAGPASDQFSLGILTYELICGRRPFSADHEAVVLYDIVNSDPAPLGERRPDVPAGLSALVTRLLAKVPEERFESMDAVVAALRSLGERVRDRRNKPSVPESSEPAVAVLPFVDMSPDLDQEYFCDGIAEEITLALSEVKGLRIVSRASTFRYKGEAYDVSKIGRELKVRGFVTGSVRKSGNTLRVSAQLVAVSDGRHLWSQRYDRHMEDVFAVQEEIARGVVEALEPKLLLAQSARKKPTANVEAYNEYLAGRYLLNQRTRTTLEQALEKFRSAISADESFGAAWGAVAETEVLRASAAYVEDIPRTFGRAREAAERAIELDPDRAEPHVALALVRLRADWDWTGAEQAFVRALEINDGYAVAHHQFALFLALVLRLDEAVAHVRRALELDPLSLLISTAVGRILHFARRYDEALEQCERTSQLDPTFVPALFDQVITHGISGNARRARLLIDRINELNADPAREAILLCRFHAMVGEREQALDQYAKMEEIARDRPLSPVLFGLSDLSLGDTEKAMKRFELAAESHDSLLVYLQCEPAYDPLREHPRYPALIRKIGFPPPPGRGSA